MKNPLAGVAPLPGIGFLPCDWRRTETESGEIISGRLVATIGGRSYPITRGIPRFVSAQNYASSFGLQWNRFREAQLDSRSGLRISTDRFFKFTKWQADELRDGFILDARVWRRALCRGGIGGRRRSGWRSTTPRR